MSRAKAPAEPMCVCGHPMGWHGGHPDLPPGSYGFCFGFACDCECFRTAEPLPKKAKATALVLRADVAPNVALSANDRGQMYRYARSQLVDAEYQTAYLKLKGQAMLAREEPDLEAGEALYGIPVSVSFRMRFPKPLTGRARLRDVDNLSGACKPWLDALCVGRGGREGLGLLVDDGPKRVRRVSYEIDTTPGDEYTEVTIQTWVEEA